MLVLSRKNGETVTLPQLGIRITVVRIGWNKVRLAFDAPQDIEIWREELRNENGQSDCGEVLDV